MSDNVLIALITASGGTVGAVLLFIRRLLPPRPQSARDVDIPALWSEMRQLRDDLDAVVRERNEYSKTARILAASNDALTAAVERTIPPIVFTRAEQQAIDIAKQHRIDDDSTWPTSGGVRADQPVSPAHD